MLHFNYYILDIAYELMAFFMIIVKIKALTKKQPYWAWKLALEYFGLYLVLFSSSSIGFKIFKACKKATSLNYTGVKKREKSWW